jgi:hypothetical protein
MLLEWEPTLNVNEQRTFCLELHKHGVIEDETNITTS